MQIKVQQDGTAGITSILISACGGGSPINCTRFPLETIAFSTYAGLCITRNIRTIYGIFISKI
jgi:hypothetical protein